jgi:hypothetical protein
MLWFRGGDNQIGNNLASKNAITAGSFGFFANGRP